MTLLRLGGDLCRGKFLAGAKIKMKALAEKVHFAAPGYLTFAFSSHSIE